MSHALCSNPMMNSKFTSQDTPWCSTYYAPWPSWGPFCSGSQGPQCTSRDPSHLWCGCWGAVVWWTHPEPVQNGNGIKTWTLRHDQANWNMPFVFLASWSSRHLQFPSPVLHSRHWHGWSAHLSHGFRLHLHRTRCISNKLMRECLRDFEFTYRKCTI